MKRNLSWYLVKLDRIAAWVLLVTILSFVVTGYGMTRGFMDVNLADQIHTHYLPVLLILSLSIHALYATRLSLKRWGIWQGKGKIILAFGYAIFLMFFLFVELFYGKLSKLNNVSSKSSPNTTAPLQNISGDNDYDEEGNGSVSTVPPQTQIGGSQSATQTFTSAELAKYDGQNGQPAYVAVNGTVYDVTNVFSNGRHHMHFAGRDLTDAFFSHHIQSQIDKYPVVGKMK